MNNTDVREQHLHPRSTLVPPTSPSVAQPTAEASSSVNHSAQPCRMTMPCCGVSDKNEVGLATPSPRQQLQWMRISQSEVEQLDEVALRARVLDQARCLRSVMQENAQLASIIDGSPDARDTIVSRLRCQVAQLQRQEEVHAVTCEALRLEAHELRRRLDGGSQPGFQTTVSHPPSMQTSLASPAPLVDLNMAIDKMSVADTTTSNSTMQVLLNINENLQTQVNKLSSRIVQLKQTDEEREAYTKQLMSRIAELENLIAKGNMTSLQQEHLDQLSLVYKQKLHTVEQQKQEAEAQCHVIRCRAERAESELAAAKRDLAMTSASSEDAACAIHRDTILALRRSVEMMRDDFASEQRDHQGALATIAALRDELELYKTQLAQFQQDAMGTLQQRRQQALHNHYSYGPYQCDAMSGDQEGFDEVDSAPSSIKCHLSSASCPQCAASFPPGGHEEQLRHADICKN